MSDYSQQHEMLLDKTHPTGAEEWYCPTCGRRFVMQWPPKYKRIVLTPGDEYVAHRGGKGGLALLSTQAARAEDPGDSEEAETLRLERWEEWFNSSETDDWWPDNPPASDQ